MIFAILTILVLNILLIAHELGHFLLAKLFNVKVEEFGVGFPPRLLSFKKGEILYSLNLIPLGAYVNVMDEDNSTELRNFRNKASWQKILILSGGVLVNILIAVVIFVLLFSIGIPRNILPNNYYLLSTNDQTIIRLPIFSAFAETFKFLYFILQQTLRGLRIAFIKIFTSLDVSDLVGPVGLFAITNKSLHYGLLFTLYILATISYALAIFNLLPIPAVDGGKIMVVLLEKIFRRRINPKIISTIENVVIVCLLFLAILVTIKDVRFFYLK